MSAVIDSGIDLAQQAITTFHTTTGLPWYLSIPAFALALNVCLKIPTWASRRRIFQKRLTIQPLVQIWVAKMKADVWRRKPGEKALDSGARHRLVVNKAQKKIYRRWGVQNWKLHTWVLHLPPFLCVTEALRRMCGGPGGLLSILRHEPQTWDFPPSTATAQAMSDSSHASDALPNDLLLSTFGGMEPSLSTGGCLWFENLMLPDPYLYPLPCVLSAILLRELLHKMSWQQIKLRMGIASRNEELKRRIELGNSSYWGSMLGFRIWLIFCVLPPAFLTSLPSALFLYWISSAASNAVVTRALERIWPLDKSVESLPCRGVVPQVLGKPK
jgi:mitochondrial inner membrane protein COX18